jgi:hypothetical protein
MVYWTSCSAASVARRTETGGFETLQGLPADGQMKLESGLVLYVVGEGGKLKEDP